MRLTNSQILTQFPSWANHPSRNIQQLLYGDIPDYKYTQEDYNKYQSCTDRHLLNIGCANAYIYSHYGTYDIYKTIPGDVYIQTSTQQLLHGTLSIPYRNKPITIHVNLMYGLKALLILSLHGTGKVKGFYNKDEQGFPANQLHTEELDIDIIKSVLNNPMSDYGYGIQKFLQAARELYTEESYNYIMQKTFDL